MAATTPESSAAAAIPRGQLAAVAAAIALATLAVYAPVADFPFLSWDDGVYVAENPNLREPFGTASVLRAFSQPYESNWIPLTWISLHLDAALFGLDPAVFHIENVLLHLATSLILLLVLARATGSLGASAFVAAVFALHPVHVESVAWVSQRKDALLGLFFSLTVAAHFCYARSKAPAARFGVVLATAAALMSKPSAVVIPFVLLAFDYWPLKRLGMNALDAPAGEQDAPWIDRAQLRRVLLEKWPLVLLVVVAAVATVFAQRNAGSLELLQLPLHWRAMNAFWNYIAYLGMTFWPSGLAYYYTWPVVDSLIWKSALSLLAMTVLWLGCMRAARTTRAPLAGLAIYVFALLPVVGFVQVGMQGRADRYMYLPLLGVAIAVAFGARASAKSVLARRALAALGVVIVLGLGTVSRAQVMHWQSGLSLYQRAIDVTHENFFAHVSLAGELDRAGRAGEAVPHYERAIELRPRFYLPHVSLARLQMRGGEAQRAEPLLERALELRPYLAEPWALLAELAVAQGQPERARDWLNRGAGQVVPGERAALDAARARLGLGRS